MQAAGELATVAAALLTRWLDDGLTRPVRILLSRLRAAGLRAQVGEVVELLVTRLPTHGR